MMAHMERNGIYCILQLYFLSAGGEMKGFYQEVICVAMLSGCRTFVFWHKQHILQFCCREQCPGSGTVEYSVLRINADHYLTL